MKMNKKPENPSFCSARGATFYASLPVLERAIRFILKLWLGVKKLISNLFAQSYILPSVSEFDPKQTRGCLSIPHEG